MIAETYLELLTDPAHLMYEITLNLVIDGILIGIVWRFFLKNQFVKFHERGHFWPKRRNR